MPRTTIMATAILAAAVLTVPAAAAQLGQTDKNAIMTAFRAQTKESGTMRFRWPDLANAPFYCGLVDTESTVGYVPFQVFGLAGKKPKLDIVFSNHKAARESVRASCERYGYSFVGAP